MNTTILLKQLRTYTPREFSAAYLKHELPLYDAVVSFSSIEHAGLGRYGDGINPWGDLLTMAKLWCVLKPRGLMLVGFPIAEQDEIPFNTQRCSNILRSN